LKNLCGTKCRLEIWQASSNPKAEKFSCTDIVIKRPLIGTRYSEELLAFLGYEVGEAGSGCCGIAGSFGYEAEHYDLSMQIGELTLFPAVRTQAESTLIVAAGVSCHEQIEQGTKRDALHPALVLHRALAADSKVS
jgi:Fe-S oxidoreductase